MSRPEAVVPCDSTGLHHIKNCMQQGPCRDLPRAALPCSAPQAHAALWPACQAYDDEQAASDLRTRRLVCQRYRPTDLPALQAAADDYADGERLPAQPSLTFESEFVQERGWARARALQLLHGEWLAGWWAGCLRGWGTNRACTLQRVKQTSLSWCG